MAASSLYTVTTKARPEDVLVNCWVFHLMVKAQAFHRHARSCILFSKYPNQKSQMIPKAYKICSRSLFQKVNAFHHWETFKGCFQISNTEVARKQFLSLTFFLVCFTVLYAQSFSFLYWRVPFSRLSSYLLHWDIHVLKVKQAPPATSIARTQCSCSYCRIIIVAMLAYITEGRGERSPKSRFG